MKLKNIGETLPNHLDIVVLLKPQTVLFGYYLDLKSKIDNWHEILFYNTSGNPFASRVSVGNGTPFPTKYTFCLEEVSRLGIKEEDLLNLFALCREGQGELYKELCKSQVLRPYRAYLQKLNHLR